MKHHLAVAIVFFSVVSFWLLGCENSENPAADPQEAQPVPELYGVWRTQWNDQEIQFFHIGPAGGNLPEGVLRMELVTHKRNGELQTHDQLMVMIPRFAGDRPVLSSAVVDRESFAEMYENGWSAEAVGDYFLTTYRMEGDNLFVRGVDREVKRSLIESGELEGSIMPSPGGSWVSKRLTEPTAKLAEFLASPEADSFFSADELVLERLGGIERPDGDLQ